MVESVCRLLKTTGNRDLLATHVGPMCSDVELKKIKIKKNAIDSKI